MREFYKLNLDFRLHSILFWGPAASTYILLVSKMVQKIFSLLILRTFDKHYYLKSDQVGKFKNTSGLHTLAFLVKNKPGQIDSRINSAMLVRFSYIFSSIFCMSVKNTFLRSQTAYQNRTSMANLQIWSFLG